MEPIPKDFVLWKGLWRSSRASAIANGELIILLKKPYEKAQKYKTRAFIVYRGVYRNGGRMVIPIEVDVKIPKLVDKDVKSKKITYDFKGKVQNQKIGYSVTKFENGQIKGKYSTDGGGREERKDNGKFAIKETDIKEINTKEIKGSCLIM